MLDRILSLFSFLPRVPWGLILSWIIYFGFLGGIVFGAVHFYMNRKPATLHEYVLPIGLPQEKGGTPQGDPQGPVSEALKPEVLVAPKTEQAPAPSVPGAPSSSPAAASATTPQAIILQPVKPEMLEKVTEGNIPKVGPQGEKSWTYYNRPFSNPEKLPTISVLVYGLGRNTEVLEKALALPGEVSLGLVPYTDSLQQVIDKARLAGHEVVLSVSMEPAQFPTQDPGPHTLLTGIPESELISRLRWALAQGAGYVGVVNLMGDKFLTSDRDLAPILRELEARGLMFIEASPPPRSVLWDQAKVIPIPLPLPGFDLNGKLSSNGQQTLLAQAELQAQKGGNATVIAHGNPVTLEVLSTWIQGLSARGIRVSPISSHGKTGEQKLPEIAAPVLPASAGTESGSDLSGSDTDAGSNISGSEEAGSDSKGLSGSTDLREKPNDKPSPKVDQKAPPPSKEKKQNART